MQSPSRLPRFSLTATQDSARKLSPTHIFWLSPSFIAPISLSLVDKCLRRWCMFTLRELWLEDKGRKTSPNIR
jgi:hypothetical protein